MFDLPKRMKAALEEDVLDTAVSFYAEAQPLLKKYGSKGTFRHIAADSELVAKDIAQVGAAGVGWGGAGWGQWGASVACGSGGGGGSRQHAGVVHTLPRCRLIPRPVMLPTLLDST